MRYARGSREVCSSGLSGQSTKDERIEDGALCESLDELVLSEEHACTQMEIVYVVSLRVAIFVFQICLSTLYSSIQYMYATLQYEYGLEVRVGPVRSGSMIIPS